MKPLLTALALALAIPICAQAQSDKSSPIGRIVLPNENLVLFSAPPSGVLKQPDPKAILSKGQDAPQLFPLVRADNGEDYVVATPHANSKDTLIVSNYRDIVQGEQVNRWLELRTKTSSDSVGWVLFGALGQDQGMLELGEKQ